MSKKRVNQKDLEEIQALSQQIDDVELQNLIEALDTVKSTETPQGVPTTEPQLVALEISKRRKEIKEILNVFLEKEPLYFPYFIEFKRQYWASIYANLRDIIAVKKDITKELISFSDSLLYQDIKNTIRTDTDDTGQFETNNLIYRYVFLVKRVLAYNFYVNYFFKCITYENIAYTIAPSHCKALEETVTRLADIYSLYVPSVQDFKLPDEVINGLPDPNSQDGIGQIAYRRPRATIDKIQEGIKVAKRSRNKHNAKQ